MYLEGVKWGGPTRSRDTVFSVIVPEKIQSGYESRVFKGAHLHSFGTDLRLDGSRPGVAPLDRVPMTRDRTRTSGEGGGVGEEVL